MPTPEQELDAALLEFERALWASFQLNETPAEHISLGQAESIQRRLSLAKAAIRRLFAERVTLRAIPPKDLGVAIPQSAILEAGRPKPLKVDR